MPKGKKHGGTKYISLKVEGPTGKEAKYWIKVNDYSDAKESDFRKYLAQFGNIRGKASISDNKPTSGEDVTKASKVK